MQTKVRKVRRMLKTYKMRDNATLWRVLQERQGDTRNICVGIDCA